MRELVGRPEPEAFDQPRGQPVFDFPREQYELVLDFGCGCGRVARQLALAAAPMPKRYVGTDLHAGMIDWCNANLAPRLRNFSFVHQNVFNPGLNPDPELPRTAPLPVEDASVSLLVAVSVFTHLVQDQAEFYLDEVSRVLRPDGVMFATFFLFEKAYFPMMQDFQNALYINADDPSNAVLLDREWLIDALRSRGLGVRASLSPTVRGFHWDMQIARGESSVALEPDRAPFGRRPPPVPSSPAQAVGADERPAGRVGSER